MSTAVCMALSFCAMFLNCAARAADEDSLPLQEVQVTASRLLDHKALVKAVKSFVKTHAADLPRTNQIGRWHDETLCPLVTGLDPTASAYVTHEILDVARGVGAPTWVAGKTCDKNVEIVFTTQPQALLDRMAKFFRILLGYYPRSEVARAMRFSRPIQAWYETGTHSLNPHPPLMLGGEISPVKQIDSDVTAKGQTPAGEASSFFSHGLRSEFVHVFVIADSNQVSKYPLQAIADYIAMISLTRMAQLDRCAPLASITDLLANDCPTQGIDSLTAADRAYLEALYATDLEKNVNLERGDMHDRMVEKIQGK